MGLAINTAHFNRYKEIASLLMRYGQSDMAKAAGLPEIMWEGNGGEPGEAGEPAPGGGRYAALAAKEANLAADLERMGPTFIRLGQFLSTRPDLLPMPYIQALSHLGENVEPLEPSEVYDVFRSETDSTFEEIFERFEIKPVSVSLFDETHGATLRGGKRVVVKVQRPGIVERVGDDMNALHEVVQFYDQHLKFGKQFDFPEIFDEFRRLVAAELDYRQEVHNLKTFKDNLKGLDLIVIPVPVEKYSTARLLTMECIEGQKLTSISELGLLRSQRLKLAQQLVYAYLQQILVDGFVDAHLVPSNILITNSNKLALLGMGMVTRITPTMQAKLLQLLLSVSEGRAEQTANLLMQLGDKRTDFDKVSFRKAVSEFILVGRDMSAEQLDVGRIIQGIAQASVKDGISLPSELVGLGTLLHNLDYAARLLDPRFDSKAFVSHHVSQMMQHHMKDVLSPSHLFHTIIETTEFLENLPGQFGKILDSIANNKLKVTVHAVDETVLIGGFQKIANRITVGLVLASLIIGASMLMNIRSGWQLFGYPGIAIICFLAAGGCGFGLVLEILIGDSRSRKRGDKI